MPSAKVHLLFSVWLDEQGEINHELEFSVADNAPTFELVLDKEAGEKNTREWISSALSDFTDDVCNFLPDNVELCREYDILFECIGEFSVMSFYDEYSGEYDEECIFELERWSIDFDNYLEETE